MHRNHFRQQHQGHWHQHFMGIDTLTNIRIFIEAILQRMGTFKQGESSFSWSTAFLLSMR